VLFLLIISTFLIIATKFLDCYTTHLRIKHPAQERNLLARKLMLRFGIKTVIWGIWGISIVLSVLCLWLLFKYYNQWYYRWTYVLLALLISFTQSAVAYTNHTGKVNRFTRWLINSKWNMGSDTK